MLGLSASSATSESYIRRHAVEIANDDFPSSVIRRMQRYKVVILGEGHGTVETPNAALSLACQLAFERPVTLALEISTDNQSGIAEFMKSGKVEILHALPHFKNGYPDGRSSVSMFNILRSARDCQNLDVLFFSPEHYGGNQDANSKMAETIQNFLAAHPSNELVVLTGNVHGSTTIGFPFDPTLKPMAFELTHRMPFPLKRSELFTIRARYGGGASWECLDDLREHCGPVKELGYPEAYTAAVKFETYFLTEPRATDGYDASLFFRNVSASPPLSE